MEPQLSLDNSSNESGGPASEFTGLTLDQRFEFSGMDFTDAMDALRETHSELSGAAANLDRFGSIWDSLPEGVYISRDDKKRVIEALQTIEMEEFSPRRLLDTLWEATADDPWGPSLTTGTMRKFYRPAREPIFHGALLISAVAQLEAHFSLIAESYYRAAPAALHDVPKESAKEFSLKDLQSMGSIEEAVESAIRARVSKLSFGSLTDWRKFFKDRMSIDLGSQAATWQQVLEIFERRHCLVHSEGQASERYARAIKGVERGKDLRPSHEYVAESMDAMEVFGTLAHASAWAKFTRDSAEIVLQLEMTAFAALTDSRWNVALPLYEHCQSLPLTHEQQLMTRVNIWLAKKGASGLDSIHDQVASWDVSGVDELYVFAKCCILDDLDSAFEQLDTLLEREKIDGADLAKWPLTAGLRADPRIRRYSDLLKGFLATEADASALASDEHPGTEDSLRSDSPDTPDPVEAPPSPADSPSPDDQPRNDPGE